VKSIIGDSAYNKALQSYKESVLDDINALSIEQGISTRNKRTFFTQVGGPDAWSEWQKYRNRRSARNRTERARENRPERLLRHLPQDYSTNPSDDYVLTFDSDRRRFGGIGRLMYDRFNVIRKEQNVRDMLNRVVEIRGVGTDGNLTNTTIEDLESINTELFIDPNTGRSVYDHYIPYLYPRDIPNTLIDKLVDKVREVRKGVKQEVVRKEGESEARFNRRKINADKKWKATRGRAVFWVNVDYSMCVSRKNGEFVEIDAHHVNPGTSNNNISIPPKVVIGPHSNVRMEIVKHLNSHSIYIKNLVAETIDYYKGDSDDSDDTFRFFAGVNAVDFYAVHTDRKASTTARSYFKIDSKLTCTSACINPKNEEDDYCVLWCLYINKLISESKTEDERLFHRKNAYRYPVPNTGGTSKRGRPRKEGTIDYNKGINHIERMNTCVKEIDDECVNRGLEPINYSMEITSDQMMVIEDYFNVYVATIICDYSYSDNDCTTKKRSGFAAKYFGRYERYIREYSRLCDEGLDTNEVVIEERPVSFIWLVRENEWLDNTEPGKSHAVYIRDIGRFVGTYEGDNATICHKCMTIVKSRKDTVLQGTTTRRVTLTCYEVLDKHLEVCDGTLVTPFKTQTVYRKVSNGESSSIDVGHNKFFTNYKYMQLHPAVVYYDMETRTEPVPAVVDKDGNVVESKISIDSEHKVYQIASAVSCVPDQSVLTEDDYDYAYYGEDSNTTSSNTFSMKVRIERENLDGSLTVRGPELPIIRAATSRDEKRLINEFILYLIKARTVLIHKLNRYPSPPLLSSEELQRFNQTQRCEYCLVELETYDSIKSEKKRLESIEKQISKTKNKTTLKQLSKNKANTADSLKDKEARLKVKDHCHITGKFRKVACKSCNNKLKWNKSIICFAHNAKGFDGIKIMNLFDPDYLLDLPGAVNAILDGYYIKKTLRNLNKKSAKKRLGDELYNLLPESMRWACELSDEDEEDADRLYNERYGTVSEESDSMEDDDLYDDYLYEEDEDDVTAGCTTDNDDTLFCRRWRQALKDRSLPEQILRFLCYESVIKNKMSGIHECASKWKTVTLMQGIEFHDTALCMSPGTTLASFVRSYTSSIGKDPESHKEAFSLVYEYIKQLYPDVSEDSIREDYCTGKGLIPYKYMNSYERLFTRLEDAPVEDYPIDEDIYKKYRAIHDMDTSMLLTKKDQMKKAIEMNRTLGCATVLEASEAYCVSDVLLLMHAFDFYRTNLFEYVGMDIAHFVGLPSFAENLYKLMDQREYGSNYYHDWISRIKELNEMIKENGIDDAFDYKVDIYENHGALVSCHNDKTRNIFRKAVAGGLSMVLRRMGHNLNELDMASLYPSAMTYDTPVSIKRDSQYPDGLRSCTVDEAYRMILEDKHMSRYFFCVDISIPLTVDESLENVPEDLRHHFNRLKSTVNSKFNGNLHDYLQHYPILMSKVVIDYDMLSPYNREGLSICREKYNKMASERFIGHMCPVEQQLGYQSLVRSQILHGARIDKVHYYIEMNTKRYFKDFVDTIYDKRRIYKIEGNAMMEKTMKNILNAAYGKTIQNPLNYTDTKLVNDYDKFVNMVSDDRFITASTISCNLAMVQMKYKEVKCNDTPHVGAAILNIAKSMMIDMIYDMRDEMPEMKLYYTDTDSIYTNIPDNFLDVMIKSNKAEKCLDIVSFGVENGAVTRDNEENIIDFNPNKFAYIQDKSLLTLDMLRNTDGQLRRFKMEKDGGHLITEAVFLKSKSGAHIKVNTKGEKTTVLKSKGVTLTRKSDAVLIDSDTGEVSEPSFEPFKKCITEGKSYEARHTAIRSKNSKIYNMTIRKKALNRVDTKSYIEDNGVDLKFYGYNQSYGYDILTPKLKHYELE